VVSSLPYSNQTKTTQNANDYVVAGFQMYLTQLVDGDRKILVPIAQAGIWAKYLQQLIVRTSI
jgi:hypothetical protein